MYDRLLKLIEAENDKWKEASKEPGDRVPVEKIRGNRVVHGMIGGVRATLNQPSTDDPRAIERQRKDTRGAAAPDIHAGREQKKS